MNGKRSTRFHAAGSLSRGTHVNINGMERPMVKFILLGECGVGKTSILNRFCDGRFTTQTQATIGVDFKYRDIDLDEGNFRLHVWDTAGQEQFHVVSKPYYRQADGVVLVYDCTSVDSLHALDRYVTEARELCPLGSTMALLGNKCDLPMGVTGVSRTDAEQFAKRRGIPIFFETSAANGQCIDEAFQLLCKHVINNRRTNGDLREIGISNGMAGTEPLRSASGRSIAPKGNVRFVQRHVNDAPDENPRKKCEC